MSRRKVFIIAFSIAFIAGAVLFWPSTEVAFYAFMAAVVEGDRGGRGYLVGWLIGTGLPALAVGWVASLVCGVKKRNELRRQEREQAIEAAKRERAELEEKIRSAA